MYAMKRELKGIDCSMNSQNPAINANSRQLLTAAASFFLLMVIVLYSDSFTFDYVYFDDTAYVLDNPNVNGGLSIDSIRWAFTSIYLSNWHPLTWMSHMLDVTLFGTDPGWAHVHNVFLHWTTTLLVFVLLRRYLASPSSAFVLALVFLVHPLHVESVAWIAERKDLLCALFFVSTLIYYDRCAAQPNRLQYAGLITLFALSLLSKPMAVTLPAVLVLLDCFHYRPPSAGVTSPFKNLFKTAMQSSIHKLPLFLISAAFSLIAIISQREGGALMDMDVISVSDRIGNAGYSYLTYLRQFVIPVDLGPYYPLKQANLIAYLLLPIGLSCLWLGAALQTIKKSPIVMLGLSWYVLTLLPVIGLIQVGTQIHADRYMYLPSLGVLMACAPLLSQVGRGSFTLIKALVIVFTVYLSVLCYWQVAYWENKGTLFNRVLHLAGPVWKAHMARLTSSKATLEYIGDTSLRPAAMRALGDLAMAVGDHAGALEFYDIAILTPSPSAALLNNYALALFSRGDAENANKMLVRALELNPSSVEYQNNFQQLFPELERQAP